MTSEEEDTNNNDKYDEEEAEEDRRRKLEEWRQKRESRMKRKRQQEQQPDSKKLLEDNDYNDEPIITAAKKLRQEQEEALLLLKKEAASHSSSSSSRRQQALERRLLGQRNIVRTNDDNDDEELHGGDDNKNKETEKGQENKNERSNEKSNKKQQESLFEKAQALQKAMSSTEREEMLKKVEEERIMKEAALVQTNALQAAKEVAHGIAYTKPMPSTWTVPKYILQQGEQIWEQIRKEWHMQTQGNDIPPPIKRFIDMKFPKPILEVLNEKNIHKPTPIQIQGLPVALAGRDMVGIAFTGSGKTLCFTLPLIMIALEEELRMPIIRNEGPTGIILAPSRELARQTYELANDICVAISNTTNYPTIRTQLLIGGESVRDQIQPFQKYGVHSVVATPGRLRDILKRKAINLNICRYICLDEADRMLDMGFDEEVGEIMNYFPHQRQTLLFSATFPKKFQDFARETLVQPIVVNVGRAGAANLDVIQEVEYVKEDAKIVYLLHCLQKTAPPVIIFCERKGAADDIHEYLLLKGVEAVSIHGGKDQEERNEAIRLFKAGEKDVLIATDVAAKGLDFPAIQHVINFDMPAEIENYVHRIGRTGRAGKTGVATTFINKSCDETTLLDLKALLKEARQRIPPVLMMLDDPREQNGGAGCSFCGGLGHTIVDCPKIDKDARRVAGSHRDVLTGGGGDW